MDLYLINAATDAKRQTCFDMTEVSIWYLSEAKVQRRKKNSSKQWLVVGSYGLWAVCAVSECHPVLRHGISCYLSEWEKNWPRHTMAGVTKARMNVTGSCSYEPKNCKPINWQQFYITAFRMTSWRPRAGVTISSDYFAVNEAWLSFSSSTFSMERCEYLTIFSIGSLSASISRAISTRPSALPSERARTFNIAR